jgi:LytS/YehU family sensor histidine kinase
MLEAQVEPHFLFNTLAHVRRLYDTDTASGERMLANLMDYLAVALPRMRESGSTLEREVNHAIAYLSIQRIRMGRRLEFDVDVEPALSTARTPTLMLVTLVENAIKHGIGRCPQGGRIAIRARAHDNRLRIEVADSGQGFVKTSGGGTGLANIRARLAAEYGDRAGLTIARNEPRGVIATISLPFADDPSAAASS